MPAAIAKQPTAFPRVIRDPAFARRLESACDGNPHVPEFTQGRLAWIKRELKRRYQIDVSSETVSKWYSGETQPRPDKAARLAELLQVDVGWLRMGIDPQMTTRERKVRNATVSGAVNIVAGLIQMDGGHPAFPVEGDARAEKENVDLYAIIRGANYALHVSMGEGDDPRFSVPAASADNDNVIVLGLVRNGMSFQVFEITPEAIANGTRRGQTVEVSLGKEVREITSFANRL